MSMKTRLNILPEPIQELIHKVSQTGYALSMPVYLVGGIVRDLILGRENLDLDFVVEGDGIVFAERLAETLQWQVRKHHRFGTATVYSPSPKIHTMTKDKGFGEMNPQDVHSPAVKIDIASARKEIYHSCGSLPVVTRATIREDLFRRDFTINAMAISINREDYGTCIDYYGGCRDVQEKTIRTLHHRSFLDDPTRIFRAIRFKERFHFSIESVTLRHLKEAVDSDVFSYIDEHRVRDEMMIILSEPSPRRYLETIQKLCGLSYIKKGLSFRASTAGFFDRLDTALKWYSGLMKQQRLPHVTRPVVYLCALLSSLNKQERTVFSRDFGLRKQEQFTLEALTDISAIVRSLKKRTITPSTVYALCKPFTPEMYIYLYATAASGTSSAVMRQRLQDFLVRYREIRLSITGEDLKMLRIHPNILYNKILLNVLKRKIDGHIHSIDDEKQEALKTFQRLRKQTG